MKTLVVDHNHGKNEKLVSVIITTIIIIVSSTLLSIVTATLINPLGLYAGGTTGLSQIILHLLGIIINGPEGWNSLIGHLSWISFVFLLPFNVLAFFSLSKKYAFYTFLSSVVQTIVFMFNDFWVSLGIFQNPDGTYQTLTCVLIAASLGGLLNGLLMRRGATSGGFITLCQYLNIKRGKSVGFLNMIVSGVIVACGFSLSFFSAAPNGATLEGKAAFGQAMSIALYTLLYFVLNNIVLDNVHTSYNKVKLEIVTEKGEEIVDRLLNEIPHGVTITKAKGGYTKRDKDMLIVIIQLDEYMKYAKLIHSIDEHAFITTLPVLRFSGKFNVQMIDK